MKKYIKPVTIELMKNIPYGVGKLVAVADKLKDVKEDAERDERISKLEEQKGELLSASGVTLYLSNAIQKIDIQNLNDILNNKFKEEFNSECRETMVDEVIVSESMIHINFTSSVEQEYLYEDVRFLIDELLEYFEESYIEVKKLEYY